MVLSVELSSDCLISEDVANKVREYLLGGSGANETFRNRSASTSSTESFSEKFPDTEAPAKSAEWMPLSQSEEKQPSQADESLMSGWISLSLLSTYSNLDYLLLANELRFVVLVRKAGQYAIHATCEIGDKLEDLINEEVCISCGDLFGLGSRRTTESLDCVIVALGLSNGLALFFTEKGTLLFFEKFTNNQPLFSIRLEQVGDSQQITISTEQTFFAVDPHSLHAALAQSKSAIARNEKNARELSNSLEIQCEHLVTEERKSLRHVYFTGMHKPSSFEQYAAASSKSYYERAERPNLPNYSTYLTCSNSYFLSFVWRDSDEREFIWNEAIKLGKSFIPHFGFRKMLGFGAVEEKKRPVGETTKVAATRGTLLDSRVAESVEIGPGPLAAIVDRAARVLLIDIENRQIIRIWKGYRDAKVVFVSVASPETKLKTAVFLVIFVPRRALLEVWSIQNGVRVGAQHVDADGLLISGGSSTVLCGIRESEQSDAYFMDKSGAIFRIIVPYHFALLRNKSRDQHDEILLPKITNRNVFDAVIFEEIYSNLRTLKGRRQAILSVLNIVKNEEDVEKMLETINKVEGSQALGHLPELISNAQICYSKFHSWHGAEPRPKLDELQNLPFDSEANAIVGKHLEKEGNRLKSDYAITNFFSLLDWGTQKTAVLKKNYSDSDILSLTEFIFGPLLENQIDIEEFDEYGLTKLPFEESDILDLFSFYFLHSQDELSFTAFGVVKEFIAYLAAKSKNEGQILDHLERTAMTSPNNSRALLLYAIVNAIRREHKMDVSEEDKEKLDRENQEQEDDDDAKPEGEKSSDWIAYDPVLEHITAILTTMHCVCLTGKLTKLPNAGGHTFEAIWPKLNGFFREEVASWVVAQKIDQPDLENRLKEEPVILELIQKLPESLKSPLLNCDISWEYASRWFKGKAENFENLKLSIDFAEAISDSRLRHGVARLLWEKFVDEPFKATAMLMEKTGRAPKEREARQQLGFGESKVSDLLQSAERLLCILLESVRDSPSSLPFQQDTMIELSTSHPPLSLSGSAPRDSLVHLALRQSLVNYHLVLHHLHLAIALRLQVSIGMRLHPLKHLFCSIGLRAFFQPFDSHPLIPLDNVDEAVMERRHDFLNKVAEQCQESERKGARQLAAEWNLTVDSIALIQVISLLRKGQDSEAAQEIASVPQNDRLATALIRIVAARIVRLADEEKTTLTPNHSSLLCEFAGEETCRVENGSVGWRASLQSMGRLLSSLPNLPQVSIASLVKLNSLSEQYFALKFY